VTGNDTDPTFVQQGLSGNTTGNPTPAHTLMLRINGAPVFAKVFSSPPPHHHLLLAHPPPPLPHSHHQPHPPTLWTHL
jgi:hypothetical protein